MPGTKCEMQQLPKMGHFARVCRSKHNKNDQRRINYVEDANSEEEESEAEEIRQVTQINKILPDNNDHYGVEMKINGKKRNFINDTDSPVTIMPYDQKIHNTKEIKPMKERYQGVNKNEIELIGKTWVTGKQRDINQISDTDYQKNDITPLLGVNWLKQLPIAKKQDHIGQRDRPIRKHIQKVPQALHHQPHKNAEVKIQRNQVATQYNKKHDQCPTTYKKM